MTAAETLTGRFGELYCIHEGMAEDSFSHLARRRAPSSRGTLVSRSTSRR